ncbi:MAG: hypothetical protein JNK49_11020 [Planctomycetes bacterium]|nr:hypothetical protein [Planctomycetota bacterium]
MLKPVLLALSTLTTLAVAQSPLVTLTGGTNQGNAGGGLYFDLQVNTTVTINQISVRTGSATTTPTTGTSVMEVWLGPSTYVGNVTNPTLWTLVTTGTGTVGPSVVAPMVLTTPIALGPGNYGVALRSLTTASGGNVAWGFGYTNGAGNNTPLICGATPGSCLNSIFTNSELTLRAGAAQNAFLTGGIFTPRIFNGEIHYTLGGTPIAVAAWEGIGRGCYDRSRATYEFWPSGAFVDFGTVTAGGSGISSMLMAFQGDRYLITPGTNAVQTPVSANLALGDDVNQVITLDPASPTIGYLGTTGLTLTAVVSMCSNGFINFDGTTGAAVAVSPANFLNNAAMYGNWKDFDPSVAGTTHYEYDGTLGAHIFTWNGVNDWNIAASPNTFQILCYDNLNVEYRWGAMSQLGGGAWPVVMGHSPGGGVRDDGGWDLSARMGGPTGTGFFSGNVDNAPLALSMTGRPLLGSSPSLVTSSMEPGQNAGFLFIGFVGTPSGASLAGFGIPECLGYVNFFASSSLFWVGSPTASQSFPIANNPAFNGVNFFAQSAAINSTFNNAFGLGVNVSNGVRARLGSL